MRSHGRDRRPLHVQTLTPVVGDWDLADHPDVRDEVARRAIDQLAACLAGRYGPPEGRVRRGPGGVLEGSHSRSGMPWAAPRTSAVASTMVQGC